MSLHVIGPYEHSAPFPDREDKEKLIGQRGMCIWMTGLSGSGKTTIGNALARMLHEAGHLTQVLDGDIIRQGICRDLGFSEDDRAENIRRTAEVSRLFVHAGIITICCFISPTKALRRMAKEIIGAEDFLEIFINTPFEVCEQRDVKGLYRKARAGAIKDFTGLDAPFEAPDVDFVDITTVGNTAEGCAVKILHAISRRGPIR
jgi:adenylylsulfate kinase